MQSSIFHLLQSQRRLQNKAYQTEINNLLAQLHYNIQQCRITGINDTGYGRREETRLMPRSKDSRSNCLSSLAVKLYPVTDQCMWSIEGKLSKMWKGSMV
jgi:hypothetical protein